MALDGIFLRHIKKEIEETALGARVSQIYQPNRDELVLVLRGFQGSKKLLLSSIFASKRPKIRRSRRCSACSSASGWAAAS